MSRTSSGVTIIGGRNDGSICGLNQDPPAPLTIPAGVLLNFTHNTGKRAYKISVTNLDAVDPVSGAPYSACNMNQVAQAGFPGLTPYNVAVSQVETAPGSGIYNIVQVHNVSGADMDCCIQIFWEVDSEELTIVQASGNADPVNDKNDPRITFQSA